MILSPCACECDGQCVKIGQRTEQGVDAGIIGDVVAEIGHRGGEDRRQPDGVNAKPLQIGQPVDDPRDIADPVAVGILEGARIDLIESAVPPPNHVDLQIILPVALGATLKPTAGSDTVRFRRIGTFFKTSH